MSAEPGFRGLNLFLTIQSKSMTEQSTAEHELGELIVNALNLEDVNPAQIDPEAPLFRDGLGLDSIDALEISLAIAQKYGVQLRSGDSENARIFASLRSLSQHIEQHRKPA
jgi:acyl carrier protein